MLVAFVAGGGGPWGALVDWDWRPESRDAVRILLLIRDMYEDAGAPRFRDGRLLRAGSPHGASRVITARILYIISGCLFALTF